MTACELVQNQAAWHKSCHNKFNNDKVKRAVRKRDRNETTENVGSGLKHNRRESMDKMACSFCKQENGHLHGFRTLEVDQSVRQMATELQDTNLIARMEGGNLVALECKCHLECLTALQNCYQSLKSQQDKESGEVSEENQVKARAFVELFTYIENCMEDGTFCFKFSILHQLYEERIKNLGIKNEINRSRLKEKILDYFPQAQEQSDGKNRILAFEQGMQQILRQVIKNNYEGEALLLAKVAKVLHTEIANFKGFNLVAAFLLVVNKNQFHHSMLLNGVDLKDQNSTDSQSILTVYQTIF